MADGLKGCRDGTMQKLCRSVAEPLFDGPTQYLFKHLRGFFTAASTSLVSSFLEVCPQASQRF